MINIGLRFCHLHFFMPGHRTIYGTPSLTCNYAYDMYAFSNFTFTEHGMEHVKMV